MNRVVINMDAQGCHSVFRDEPTASETAPTKRCRSSASRKCVSSFATIQ